MQYSCDGVPYLKYKELSISNRIIKLILPLLRSKIFKGVYRVPYRCLNEMFRRKSQFLHWKRLRPRFDLKDKVADAEAFAQIDTYECIRWFTARGYSCISHNRFFKRVFAGHDIVILKKERQIN